MRELEGSDAWGLDHVDVERLNRLAADALTMEYTQKHWKPEERIEVAEDLPLTDCYVAPVLLPALSSKIFRNTSVCLANTAMPTRWNSSTNATPCPPLPVIFAITSANTLYPPGLRQCAEYPRTEKVALEKGWDEYKQRWHKPAGSGSRHPVAVIGAGPAGLAAGYFLARAGHPVTLFEREANAGGVVKNIIPQFRIPAELIQHDIDFLLPLTA